MPVITLPTDTRWGDLGQGIGNILGAVVNRIDDQRTAHGVATIDQDPNIPPEQKYSAALDRFGAKGAALYDKMQLAKARQAELQAFTEKVLSGDIAWQGLSGMDQGQPGLTGPAATTGLGDGGGAAGPTQLHPGTAPVTPVARQALPAMPTQGTAMPAGGLGRVRVAGGPQDPSVPMQAAADVPPFTAEGPGAPPAGSTGAGAVPPKPAAGPSAAQPVLDPTTGEYRAAGTEAGRSAGATAARGDKVAGRASDMADEALSGVSALQYGRMQRRQLAQAIEAANPNAPAHVKMMAFEEASKVLAPEEKMAWELDKARMSMDRQVFLAQLRSDMAVERAADKPQFFQQGDQLVRVQPGMGPGQESVTPVAGTKGVTRIGGPQTGAVLTDTQATYWANYMNTVGTLPPGIARSTAAVRQIMGRAADLAGGVDPGEMAARMSSFKANQSSLTQATRYADQATQFEETALKNLAVATEMLHGAAPTNMGPFINKWIEQGEQFLGDKSVPKNLVAVLTFANEYAKVMSGSVGAAGATVSAREEAAERFSPYFSAGQWDEVAKIARRDMANRKAALYENVDNIRTRIAQSGRTTTAVPPGASGAGQPAEVPKEAVEMLKRDPSKERRRYFDDTFGEGAAARVLGETK